MSWAPSLLLLGSVGADAAPTKIKKKKPPIKKIIDIELMNELKMIVLQLANTDKDYKGHRAKGIKLLKVAINALAAEAKANGHVVKPPPQAPEPQAVSDATIKAVIVKLNGVIKQINGLKATKGRQAAGENIVLAIAEFKIALTIA